jgi:hypothetical protein
MAQLVPHVVVLRDASLHEPDVSAAYSVTGAAAWRSAAEEAAGQQVGKAGGHAGGQGGSSASGSQEAATGPAGGSAAVVLAHSGGFLAYEAQGTGAAWAAGLSSGPKFAPAGEWLCLPAPCCADSGVP